MFRSEDICLVQIFLQSGSAYNCISELGELGLVEFRDLNPDVNLFQRKFVNEIRRCEELEKRFVFLEHQLSIAVPMSLDEILKTPCSAPAPQPRDLLHIEEQSERLAIQLSEVSTNRESLRRQLIHLKQYRSVLLQTHSLIQTQALPPPAHAPLDFSTLDYDCDNHLSFVAGVVHPWKVAAFERLLWRACRGYFIIDFQEMHKMEAPQTGEMAQWTVFLISFWGKTIGCKVKKICDCFHANTFLYPENAEDREELLEGLQNRIEDISKVLSQTESYLQQLLSQCVSVLPMWKVKVGKCKAVHSILNLCSPSVTEKCLIAEAWCPTKKLLLLQSALIEGTRRSGSVVDSFYNRLPLSSSSSPPPTLFITNSFTAAFQSIVDAYGVAQYKEINPAVYTIITFPFLFAVMFGDVGHGMLMAAAALWMIMIKEENKSTQNKNELWRLVYIGRYLILLMGLFSIYTGAIYNDCFSRGATVFPSGWHLQAMNWSAETLKTNQILSLDPNTTGVFLGPYPLGIDPIWHLANNRLSFLNSYKMKLSVIIGVLHMTFGICLSYFNYSYRRQWSDMLLVLLPELVFMLGLFGYLVFLIFYKWVFFGPHQSDQAPSLLLHFINMVLFTKNKETQPLYHGQWCVQLVLMVTVLTSVPVLLLGKPLYLLYYHRKHQQSMSGSEAVTDTSSINALLGDVEGGNSEQKEFDAVEVFMHQTLHTLEYCLGCVSNSASYLRLWALSLAHAQLSDVLWMMVMRISLSSRGMLGSVVLAVVFSFFALLTVSILLVMEGLSAFLHALRLHWVEFQSKFYSGTGYKFNPFSFSHITIQS
ncbi:V-type proton ATPase 116 kDa subunit a 2-like [Boleophthalmus pectinirostris]|uniref:V-type proton ATPase 116 kDa subunit a 2-like n=1 Tax=Boleophthalmus pectinirostris TaxID=150288 RepID=UPI00242C6931|nr:V-type proton ATPase 116 kDa subunit a 2-like [Boleophthalmus pectinirostris]